MAKITPGAQHGATFNSHSNTFAHLLDAEITQNILPKFESRVPKLNSLFAMRRGYKVLCLEIY